MAQVESVGAKMWRHVKEHDFRPETLKRGLAAVYHSLVFMTQYSSLTEGRRLLLTEETKDYDGVANLDVYGFQISRRMKGLGGVSLAVFPADADLAIVVTAKHDPREDTNKGVDLVPGAIASFTGPTFFLSDNVPNNGFFHRLDKQRPDGNYEIPFMETDPPGDRRGAFGVRDDGTVVLMSDTEKWGVVQSNFAGYSAVVGTSYFMSSADTVEDIELHNDFWFSSKLSYLVQMKQSDGTTRLAYFVSSGHLMRPVVKKALDNFCTFSGVDSYMAVELERNSSNAVLQGSSGQRRIIGGKKGGYTSRRDHYVMYRRVQSL